MKINESPSSLSQILVARSGIPLAVFIPDVECWAISLTQVGNPRCNDRLIWPINKQGMYSIKSRYWWLHINAQQQRTRRPSFSIATDPSVWKCIWGINAPPKIRNFL
ncbi:hypothetical protein ACFX19_044659 [Malus domestica]